MIAQMNDTSSPTFDGVNQSEWTRQARILFIIGAPRSGTTWLQAMLASHPAVATGPETHLFKIMSTVESAFLLKLPRPVGLDQYLSPEEFYAILADLFHQVASRIPRPESPQVYFLEKTPEHALYAPLILRCLPRARFVHLLRDGRHVVSSLIRAHSNWGKPDGACSATVAAGVWQQCVLAARRIPDLLPDRDDFREIRYENLRHDTGRGLAQLFEWLGLPATKSHISEIVACNDLETTRQKKTFDSISQPGFSEQDGARKEPEVFFGKAATDPHSFQLSRLQEYQCYRTCGGLLRELGYCASPRVPWWAHVGCSWKVRALLGLRPV